MEFEVLRNKYKRFIYKKYQIFQDDNKIYLEYEFEIENLSKFYPKIEILKKDFKFKDINSNIVKNMVFNIGMIELISYYKATCCPQIVIECGKLDKYQEEWFKKLYYLGTGEFRYINDIKISKEDFFEFVSNGETIEVLPDKEDLKGIIIPIGRW